MPPGRPRNLPDTEIGPFLDLIAHDNREALLGPDGVDIICRAITAGPLPPPLLLRFAIDTGFSGLPLIERAVSAASSGDGLFEPSPSEDRDSPQPQPLYVSIDDLEGTVDRAIEIIQEVLGEVREGQASMARTVLTALSCDEISFIEAGTGTGKSLAYLVPSVLFAAATGERVVISTHTKNLQQQLMKKEMPVLRRLTGCNLSIERLMGRENYICARKAVSKIMAVSNEDIGAALHLAIAASLAFDGTAESIPLHVRNFPARSICAPARCMMKGCSHASRCHLLMARRRAADASILFVNHALLMTDHRQGGSIVGPYERVIIDEAHHLERCVMDNLSLRISEGTLDRVFDEIDPISQRTERWKMLVLELESGGGVSRDGGWPERIKELSRARKELAGIYSSLFDLLSSMPEAGPQATRSRYTAGAFYGAEEAFGSFYLKIKELRGLLKVFYKADMPQSLSVLINELRYVDDELEVLAENVRYLHDADDPDSVFWIESSGNKRVTAICGSPLEIDRNFADYLEERVLSAVFTSATLSENGSFDYIMKRLGIGLTGKEPVNLEAGSPFDYENNLMIMRTGDRIDPNDESFAGIVARMIDDLAGVTGRRIMSLFTSYRMCLATADELERLGFGGTLIVQGDGRSREELASNFRATDGAVLLGVASFWEGVDFPGGELEILVIPKLPFPVPSEPVIEARSERMEADGINPFTALSLPEAILKLRQGVGRLIRRKKDRGVAVLMDPRLGSKSYAPAVLSSLPVPTRFVSSAAEAASLALDWFERECN
jgi:ATP-dependent DNA helicase DinG